MRLFCILFIALCLSSLQVTVVAQNVKRVNVQPRQNQDFSRKRSGALAPGDNSYEALNLLVNLHAIDYYARAVVSYDKATNLNKVSGAFRGAQLIAGVAAFSLGVTMVVVTAGGAAVPIAIAFTASSLGAGVSGAVARVSETRRDKHSNVPETRSKYKLVRGWQWATKPFKKGNDLATKKLGAAKFEATKAIVATVGREDVAVEIGIIAARETVVAVGLSGVAGAAGGAYSAFTSGVAIKNAYEFSDKAKDNMFEDGYWASLEKNLEKQGFKLGQPTSKDTWGVFHDQLQIFKVVLEEMKSNHENREEFIEEFIKEILNRVYGALKIAKNKTTPGRAKKFLSCITPKCFNRKATNRVEPALPEFIVVSHKE
mmetsp:Transcript_15725/g.21846  ORF Transcript_15725/g.21846 Transcript_15725/m.21846 type:complete len:371 (+) Transcript_15725:438-1550(+)